jgi:hypothetical protein
MQSIEAFLFIGGTVRIFPFFHRPFHRAVKMAWKPIFMDQSLGENGLVDQPSTITVAGPSRIRTGFPIKFPNATPEATPQFLRPRNAVCQPGGAAILCDVTDFHPSAYKSARTGR